MVKVRPVCDVRVREVPVSLERFAAALDWAIRVWESLALWLLALAQERFAATLSLVAE